MACRFGRDVFGGRPGRDADLAVPGYEGTHGLWTSVVRVLPDATGGIAEFGTAPKDDARLRDSSGDDNHDRPAGVRQTTDGAGRKLNTIGMNTSDIR